MNSTPAPPAHPVPIIRFMACSSGMGGLLWSDATPREYGGCGVPIPEDQKEYEKCKKEGIPFYWTISTTTRPSVVIRENFHSIHPSPSASIEK